MVGETELLAENFRQRHLIKEKSYKAWPGIEADPVRWNSND
jgi:hypothetical protein